MISTILYSLVLLAISLALAYCFWAVYCKRKKTVAKIFLGMLSRDQLVEEVLRLVAKGAPGDFIVAATMRSGHFLQFKVSSDTEDTLSLYSDIPTIGASRSDISHLENMIKRHQITSSIIQEETLNFYRIKLTPNQSDVLDFIVRMESVLGILDSEVYAITLDSATFRILKI